MRRKELRPCMLRQLTIDGYPRLASSKTMTMLCTRCLRAVRQQLRRFSTYPPLLSSAPVLSTPITKPGEAPPPTEPPPARSICVAGTVLTGLNFTKGGKDPVAMKDEDYPEWLWSCLDVIKTKSDKGNHDAGDEFSKSKKTRREAAKRARALEAAGGLTAPKIPVQRQSINLPGEEGGSVEDNIDAIYKREELRKAMRKERKAKIKETNFLKSM
ncbi:hypothetical protein L249_3471 [Ophiocordyceps polyrhachis-furcata BCC 54312]|uniref:Large ribosomal subunit protein mL54 n=1 Tax=Ophiocordyceps polyrhachis-furcata BCC 54312 TaxID=1330021 RepID=A0A367LMH7_9HYPO|nr:hypothetical protein L249_3471 [Ophiocordyceps polyrhachis-furcata BCC 54312]